jgi:hypothetical protein
MADTLVGRLTGQNRATDLSVELQLMMPLEAVTEPNEPERCDDSRVWTPTE